MSHFLPYAIVACLARFACVGAGACTSWPHGYPEEHQRGTCDLQAQRESCRTGLHNVGTASSEEVAMFLPEAIEHCPRPGSSEWSSNQLSGAHVKV